MQKRMLCSGNQKFQKREDVTIKCDFGDNYEEVQKHPMEENRRQTSSRLDNCPLKIYGNFF